MPMKILAENGMHIRTEADHGLMLEYWATPGIPIERIVRLGRFPVVKVNA